MPYMPSCLHQQDGTWVYSEMTCWTFRQSSGTGYDIKSSFSSGWCTLASVHPFIQYHDKGIDNKERNLTDKGYLMCGTCWGATLPVALCPQASETIGLNSRYFQHSPTVQYLCKQGILLRFHGIHLSTFCVLFLAVSVSLLLCCWAFLTYMPNFTTCPACLLC